QLVRLEAGETLIKQGMPADSFFLLLDGKVSVYSERDNGDSILLGEVTAPATLGEVGLLIGSRRTATVIADTNIQTMRYREPGFVALFDTLEGFGLHVSRFLAKRLDEVSSMLQKSEGDQFAGNIIYDIGHLDDELTVEQEDIAEATDAKDTASNQG
ncbi:MAG: cyclic nucleotide-binding domain-containing protein, partial [Gammaproteobacteria bacterium]